MFKKLLIANRGEIARRICQVAHRMGIPTVAVHSDADAELPFVREADQAVRIGAAPPRESYLNAPARRQSTRAMDSSRRARILRSLAPMPGSPSSVLLPSRWPG
jgi:acetyl/propionyl-CoA carboxylase alpha subunit